MGLYLGGNKYKLHIGSSALVLAAKKIISGLGFTLTTVNNEILTDANGMYLTLKDGE